MRKKSRRIDHQAAVERILYSMKLARAWKTYEKGPTDREI